MSDTTAIRISTSDPSFGPVKTPDFPWVRFDTGLTIHDEVLIEGQYLGGPWSAMGRPSSRQRLWESLSGKPASIYPQRQLQHAFQLNIDGQLLVDHWEWMEGSEVPCKIGGCRESLVKLRHTLRPVEVEVHTLLDGTPFMQRWLTIRNTGDRPAAVAQADPWSGLLFFRVEDYNHPINVEPVFEVGRFRTPDWGQEGEFAFEPVPQGGLVIESRFGSSGHRPPFFMVRSSITGETFAGSLAYPANWRLELLHDDNLKKIGNRTVTLDFRFGPAGPAPLYVMSPGESITTPRVHLGQSFGDLDTLIQRWHAHLRASVIPKQPEGRRHWVECNHTGYTGNAQMNEEGFLAEVETAAAVGCEMFLVDAGWFGDASGNWSVLMGDWSESALLPRGLQPVYDHARKLGMACGLWMAIENVGTSSKAAKEHPDWLMKRRGQTMHMLDLSRPDVAQHVEDTIARFVEKFRLDVYRIDGGTNSFGDGPESIRDGFVESGYWRYYDNLARVVENLQRRFPKLILQNCSGGGGRSDLAMLSRFHYTQLSDNWSPGPAIKIHNGISMYLAPEQCMTLLGAISAGVSDLDFLLRIGLFGHFCMSGAFPSMDLRNQQGLSRWGHHTDLYKRFVRPMLDTCRVFHHTPFLRHYEPGDWAVLEHASADGSRAYAGIWRLTAPGAGSCQFIPRGLARDRHYRVTFENSGTAVELSGHELSNCGIHLTGLAPMTSELLLFEAV